MSNNAPCYGCETRTSDCHGKCELYADWKVQHENELKTQRNRKSSYMNYMDYAINRNITLAKAKKIRVRIGAK